MILLRSTAAPAARSSAASVKIGLDICLGICNNGGVSDNNKDGKEDKVKVTMYELGKKGLVKIDVPANSLKNNLTPGAVLHWGGNMGFPAQKFAVIRREESSFGVYYDTIGLEDYSTHRVEGYSIKAETDQSVWHAQHFFLTEQKLSADELLELIDRNKAKKIADEATVTQEVNAFRADVDRLRKLDNGLAQSSETMYAGQVLAAKNIRKELKAAFPKTKFTVRSESYTGGDNINVGWTDGPTVEQVEKITQKYSGGSFDGMTDSYNSSRTPWTEVYGSTKYLFENRHYSRAFVEATLRAAGYIDQVTIKGSDESAWIEAADQSTEHWARKALSEAAQ
jgi:hypothetical protein